MPDASLPERVAAAMGQAGPLRKRVPGYEVRPHQLRAAIAISKAIEEGRTLLLEAPTGSGKSLSALVPLALYLMDREDGRASYSTATITLQEQVFYKDLPAVQRVFGSPAAALLKGMSRYACLVKWIAFRDTTSPAVRAGELAQVDAWIRSTQTGDQAELDRVPSWWDEIAASTSDCPGPACGLARACFAMLARSRAISSQLVVTNHHLACNLIEKGSLIDPAGPIVFDEAHRLADVASSAFGASVDVERIRSVLRRALAIRPGGSTSIRELVLKAELALADFSASVRPDRTAEAHPIGPRGRLAARRLLDVLGALDSAVRFERWDAFPDARGASEADRAVSCLRAIESITEQLSYFADPPPDTASWAEHAGPANARVVLHSCPVDLAPFTRKLFSAGRARVLMSATLSHSGSFAYLRKRLGIDDADEMVLPEVFDYRKLMRYYFPLPPIDPKSPDYIDRVTSELFGLLRATRGRALVLFTSYADMREVYGRLAGKLPYELLVQDEASASGIVEAFREDVHSILLATSRMWEGVDVPGPSLSVLVVARLPFDVPTHPLALARYEAARARGENPFFSVVLPEAITRMRQGIGRLIRSPHDRGIAAILDGRVLTRPYGRLFLAALPRAPQVRSHEEAARFLDGHS